MAGTEACLMHIEPDILECSLTEAKFPLAAAFLSDITKLTKVNDILVPKSRNRALGILRRNWENHKRLHRSLNSQFISDSGTKALNSKPLVQGHGARLFGLHHKSIPEIPMWHVFNVSIHFSRKQ